MPQRRARADDATIDGRAAHAAAGYREPPTDARLDIRARGVWGGTFECALFYQRPTTLPSGGNALCHASVGVRCELV